MKLSFDYDGTLERSLVQDIEKFFNKHGNEIFIISARSKRLGGPVYDMAKTLNIPESNVILTGSNSKKIEAIETNGIDVHFDNNPDVVNKLNERVFKSILI